MARWLIAVCLAACTAPQVRGVIPDDSSVSEVASDAAPEVASDVYQLNPAATCTGHDEDRDGFPDDCDTCPSIANAGQAFEAETQPKYANIGRDCYAGSGFEDAKKRVLFDPFTELLPSWTGSFGLGAFLPKDDMLRGGEVADVLHYVLWSKPLLDAKTVVATAIIGVSRSEGSFSYAGVMVRASGTPLRFIACHHDGANFFLSAADPAGCTTSSCKLQALAPAKRYPWAVIEPPKYPLGLRLSIARGATEATVECRMFDPKDPSRSVTQGSADFSITTTVKAPSYLERGEVGLIGYHTSVDFASLDVLASD